MLWLDLLSIDSEDSKLLEINFRPDVIPKSALWISALAEAGNEQFDESSSGDEDDAKWCLKLAESLKQKMQADWNDVKGKTADELIDRKEKVKMLLRKYDRSFEQKYRRPPVRQEKEPMRALYELYRNLKTAAAKALTSTVKESVLPDNLTKAQRLEALTAEKAQIGRQLQAFSDAFEKKHGRKVKYARDIAAVQTKYVQYKKLKQQILELNQHTGASSF